MALPYYNVLSWRMRRVVAKEIDAKEEMLNGLLPCCVICICKKNKTLWNLPCQINGVLQTDISRRLTKSFILNLYSKEVIYIQTQQSHACLTQVVKFKIKCTPSIIGCDFNFKVTTTIQKRMSVKPWIGTT